MEIEMLKSAEIAEALADTGYLARSDIEIAAKLLSDRLAVENLEEARVSAIRDEVYQENILAGERAMEEQDALLGDKKGLKVDQAMIQESLDQQQVDELAIKNAEAKILAAYDKAAAALAAFGLIMKKSIDDVAMSMTKHLKMGMDWASLPLGISSVTGVYQG
jgi:uncharacterized protein YdaT